MTSVFLDTSGLVALVNTDDQWHGAAEAAWGKLVDSSAPLVTALLFSSNWLTVCPVSNIEVWPYDGGCTKSLDAGRDRPS